VNNKSGTEGILRCSFCHKSQDAVAKLISSPRDYPRAYICDECVAVCNSILKDDLNRLYARTTKGSNGNGRSELDYKSLLRNRAGFSTPHPTVPAVVKKLLSLDTPVSGRIFEIALLLGLIIGAAYVKNSVKDTTVQFAAALVLVFGALILFILLALLVAVVVRGASETRPKDEK
jgi:hypothetical protein